MQLTSRRSIRGAVAALSATLLGTSAASAATTDSSRVESSLLLYSETSRVKAAEAILNFQKPLKHDRMLTARVTYDGLTGASPNGATPSKRIQTFTSPSGNAGYSVQPGDTPLDNTFKDTRIAGDLTLAQPLDRLSNVTMGAHLSLEHDYTSLGVNAGITRDFNRRNTTLGVSLALTHDIVRPIGGAPTALSSMPTPSQSGGEFEAEGGGGGPGESKNIIDVVVGGSQVLDRKTVMRVNYSYDRSSGYLNDPYKLLSVVQPSGPDAGEPTDYLYESRPRTRAKQAVFGELRRYIAGSTVDLAYRYYWDDWGITSNTIDFLYRQPLPGGHAIEPHVRWYRQTAADFHYYYLVQGQSTPQYASADSRLAAFDAYTLGLTYSFPVMENARLSIGAEYYTQKGKDQPSNAIGTLKNYDLFPKLNVFMLRIGYSHGF